MNFQRVDHREAHLTQQIHMDVHNDPQVVAAAAAAVAEAKQETQQVRNFAEQAVGSVQMQLQAALEQRAQQDAAIAQLQYQLNQESQRAAVAEGTISAQREASEADKKAALDAQAFYAEVRHSEIIGSLTNSQRVDSRPSPISKVLDTADSV